jgi:hypothetical protein
MYIPQKAKIKKGTSSSRTSIHIRHFLFISRYDDPSTKPNYKHLSSSNYIRIANRCKLFYVYVFFFLNLYTKRGKNSYMLGQGGNKIRDQFSSFQHIYDITPSQATLVSRLLFGQTTFV